MYTGNHDYDEGRKAGSRGGKRPHNSKGHNYCKGWLNGARARARRIREREEAERRRRQSG